MKITFEENENCLEAKLSNISDGKLFVAIANAITGKFHVTWIRKLDGLDQRYWDFEIDDCKLTLHLEHYLGISLFPTSKTGNANLENESIKRIADYLADMSFEEAA